MKCETQCHMLCLKHPSLYFLFFFSLAEQKLKATTAWLPSFLQDLPTIHSNKQNPKWKKKILKKKARACLEKTQQIQLYRLIIAPQFSHFLYYLLSLNIVYPFQYIIHSLFLCTKKTFNCIVLTGTVLNDSLLQVFFLFVLTKKEKKKKN